MERKYLIFQILGGLLIVHSFWLYIHFPFTFNIWTHSCQIIQGRFP